MIDDEARMAQDVAWLLVRQRSYGGPNLLPTRHVRPRMRQITARGWELYYQDYQGIREAEGGAGPNAARVARTCGTDDATRRGPGASGNPPLASLASGGANPIPQLAGQRGHSAPRAGTARSKRPRLDMSYLLAIAIGAAVAFLFDLFVLLTRRP